MYDTFVLKIFGKLLIRIKSFSEKSKVCTNKKGFCTSKCFILTKDADRQLFPFITFDYLLSSDSKMVNLFKK